MAVVEEKKRSARARAKAHRPASAAGKPAAQPRFTSRYDLRGLVDVVAEVARVADSRQPERVTQAQWDAARASAGHADAPAARQVATRLTMGWVEVLALALDGRDIDKALGSHLSEDDDPYLTHDADDVRAALRVVALRLGKRTLTPRAYADERAQMLTAARRRWRHRADPALPSVSQVEHIAGSWDAALALAGLGPRPPQERSEGLPIVDALELALEAHGALLTKPELGRFAAANNLSVARHKRGKPWGDYLAELRTRRADWGKWTPPAPPLFGTRPDYSVAVPLPPDAPRRRKRRWTRAECVAALAALLAELPPRTRLTLRRYQQEAVGRRDLPHLASLQRHGGFSEVVAEARRTRR